jgi:MFS family permease
MAIAVGSATEPSELVSNRWIAAISLANLGLFMAYFGPLAVLLPNQIQEIAGPHKVVAFGWVTGLGALVAAVANPLAGALSDRTAGRFGRRRPWVLGGALASAAALALLASLHTVGWIILGWCLTQAGLNAMQAGIAASVPDQVPVPQRGAVSAFLGIPQCVAVIIAVYLVTNAIRGSAGYLMLAIVTTALALPFALGRTDAPVPEEYRPPPLGAAFLRSFWVSAARHPDFRWAWLTRFLMVLGNSAAVLYLLYFLRDDVHYRAAENGLVILLLIYTTVVVVTAVVSGVLSDRSGQRRRLVALSGVIMAIPAALLALWPIWPVVLAASAVLGCGFGIYLSVDQALVTQVLPTADGHGRDMGVISVSSSAGQALAPAIAAPLVTYLGGYSTLYWCVALIVLSGSAAVWRIRSVA